jgi:dienelactone hydrolase
MNRRIFTLMILVAIVLVMLLATASGGGAAMIKEQYHEYSHNGTVLEGFAAWDEDVEGKRPGIIVVHEWNGINPQILQRCRMLAELGYFAFAADIYGKGVRPQNPEESAKQATLYRKDRVLMRARANAALDEIRKFPQVYPDKVATMGYCFGGGVALEQARSGADIVGALSFHGNLDTPDLTDAGNIKAKILVLHGAADPYVPIEQVMTFRKEMEEAGVDWQLVMYGHAVHSFTNPGAGDDPSKGAAYNEKADSRSWEAMISFFEELF